MEVSEAEDGGTEEEDARGCKRRRHQGGKAFLLFFSLNFADVWEISN